MASTLAQLSDYQLAVDCGELGCGGWRIYPLDELARLYGGEKRLASLVRLLRCRGCGAAPAACVLETGPKLAQRGRMRRLALIGTRGGDPGQD